MALAHPNQMSPLSTATTTAKDRPIIDWLPLARMAPIIAIVTTARAAGKAASLPAVRLIRQQATADRVRQTAKINAAPFRRFVITVMATAWSAAIGARAIHTVAAVARTKARTATAADVRDSRETGAPTCLVMGRAAAAENATAPAGQPEQLEEHGVGDPVWDGLLLNLRCRYPNGGLKSPERRGEIGRNLIQPTRG